MLLTALEPNYVSYIFLQCLVRKDEDQREAVFAPGIMVNVSFNKDRLEHFNEEITGLLEELPEHEMCFLEARKDRSGKIWSKHPYPVEQLLQLGIAVGKVQVLSPRVLWKVCK